jgi:acetyl-CoA acetyltransferase
MRRAAIVNPLRAAVGKYGGSLQALQAQHLAAHVTRAVIERSDISLGHPIASTGVRILKTPLHELARRKGKYGLETLCIGGGRGLAANFERA